MTFYQELQLNQAGSKQVIRNSETKKEKLYHTAVYLTKIVITMIFCFTFVTAYSLAFGSENSIVGVVVLLSVMVFRNAHLDIHAGESTALLGVFFAIMTICPHLANVLGPFAGILINMGAIFIIMVLGCNNPLMSNQSTLVLGYLLLYGYDVSGDAYVMRLAGMAVGGIMTCIVFYRNHGKRTYKLRVKDVVKNFSLGYSRSRWQLCLTICVPIVVFIGEICDVPRAMWGGIAAMSAIVPIMENMKPRVSGRIIGNIAGVICFLALYFWLPDTIYAYIGIIGGIGVGFSVRYGWQSVFNTFGALAIAEESFGLLNAVGLRVAQNVFGVLFALMFCVLFNQLMKKVPVLEEREMAYSAD